MILFAVTFPKEKGHSFECPLLVGMTIVNGL